MALAGRPWRLSSRLLIACSAVTMMGFSAICGNVMFEMRRSAVDLARQSLDNLASGIEADISRNVELYDLSLRAVASGMVLPELKNLSKPIQHLILFDHAATAQHFGAIEVFGPDGQLTNDASTLDPVPVNRADEEYFRVHRDRPDTDLFISRPMLHHGAYAIVLSRRITGADGGFLGVVAGSIRFSYFHDLFGRLNLGPNDLISVLRRDGTIIMRTPLDLDLIGRNIGEMPVVVHALSEPNGYSAVAGKIDGVPRLVVWRNRAQPLVVLVGRPWEGIFNIWRGEAIRIGALMAALVAFSLATTLVLAREIRRRGDAEYQLEELATTDSLTGLRNRRKFDADIDSEWRRALGHKTQLSLLMIDADHFKAYNDSFGHLAGDQVLVGIAICISDSITPPGDCAARYGGEEFAVLLPGRSLSEALAVAETIRCKVEGWSDDATPSTVSIGVASMHPAEGFDWPQFVDMADKALYAAKAAGRNCCVLAAPPALPLAA
jgi:diguanylate cyclase (GGDEF)-like protein